MLLLRNDNYNGSGLNEIHGKQIPIEYKQYWIAAMNRYAAQFAEPPMHQCIYCGALTDQPDENCYKAPKTKVK